MPKRKKTKGPKLRRSCGAMAAHMMLLERFPSFRASQMRLEGVTSRRRDSGADLKKIKVVTVKTVVNVVYNTAQQNVSDAQIKSQIAALNNVSVRLLFPNVHTPDRLMRQVATGFRLQ